MKKLLFIVFTILLAALSGCSSNSSGNEFKTVKVGISGSDTRVWDYISEKAEKEGIKIEIVKFSDYVQPNMALAEGEIDANAFQTVAYFNAFKKDHKLDLSAIGTTVLAPMGVFSNKVKDISEIQKGDEIAVPNDVTNLGRALLLLEKANLIKLKAGFDGKGGLENVTDYKGLKITPVVAGQAPRALDDVAASVINNGIAVDAGLNPKEDAIFREDKTAVPYVNIIAAQTKRKNDKTLIKLVEIYQSEAVTKFIQKTYKGATIPTIIPVKEIQNL
ncbi:D-methionine transport system substrate-binding protein [Peribacillus deserti]|uniref:Lipoprotein n=1 Tax=Peribacillus deserti TaxID=673318 RepID=A0ABS2QLM9_9BACI|nr:MetQ/NlpA family ABC transporter substrate-binding protein [Peribacillus deserti]MBM7693146.1 D-methionine transport system substrate-binding protein [Peribacillus deserti]